MLYAAKRDACTKLAEGQSTMVEFSAPVAKRDKSGEGDDSQGVQRAWDAKLVAETGWRHRPKQPPQRLQPGSGLDAFRSAFSALQAEGNTPSSGTVQRARAAAINLVRSAIKDGRPDNITAARTGMGTEEFARQLDAAGISPAYVSGTERILAAGNARDAKALGDIGREMSAALNRDIANRSLTPLGFAAGEAQLQIAAGKPFSPAAMPGSIYGGWTDGVTTPAKIPLSATEKAALLPGFAVGKMLYTTGRALGDFSAVCDGPVQVPDGGSLVKYDLEGRPYTLYRNKVTGEDLWIDPDLHVLTERGTPMVIGGLAVTGSIPLRSALPGRSAAFPAGRPAGETLRQNVETLGPEGVRALIKKRREAGGFTPAEERQLLTAMIAGPDTPARQVVLQEFSGRFSPAAADLSRFRRPDGTQMAQTQDQRTQLTSILVQDTAMTPAKFASHQDMLRLSRAVYLKDRLQPVLGVNEVVTPNYGRVTLGADPRLRGLTRADFENSRTKFYAELFRNKDGKYALAFRGTQSGWDWVENFTQLAGLEARQYKQAMVLADNLGKRLGDDFYAVTGHSQGGGQAAAASMVARKPAILFNAAGLNTRTVARAGAEWKPDLITHYYIEGEGLALFQQETSATSRLIPKVPGKQISLRAFDDQGNFTNSYGPVNRHLGYNLLRSMLNDPHAPPTVAIWWK